MTIYRDIKLKRQSREARKQDKLPFKRAVLTDEGGQQTSSDPLNDVWASASERRAWYMTDGATQPAQILCRKVSDPYVGLGVIIGYADGSNELEVLSDDFFLTHTGDPTAWASTAPRDFEPGGRKMMWVYTKVITPLATYPDATGLTVNIIAGDYPYDGARKTFAGSVSFALTQNPNPGEHYLAGLYLDSANTLQVVYGASVATAIDAPEPSWPAGSFRLSAVLIDDVQTSIDFDADIFDRRMAWSDEESSGGNAWPKPNKVNIGTTEYATITLAIAAANVGDTLYAAGAFTENVTLNKAVRLVGLGQGAFSITGTVTITDAGAIFENCTVTATSGTGAVNVSVAATIINIIATYSGGTNARGISITSNNAILIDCKATVSGGSITNRGLYVSGTGVRDYRGNYAASGSSTADIYADGVSILCFDTVISASGTTVGTINGNIRFGNNARINVPANSSLIFSDDAQAVFVNGANIAPINMVERSIEPVTPSTNDIYLDDGTNTDGGLPSFRRYDGAAWEDIGSSGLGLGIWLLDISAGQKISQATLAAAITAAASGDSIFLDTDTYSVAASQNIGVSLTIEGDGPEATIYTTSVSNSTAFDITADSITVVFRNMTIRHTGGGVAATGIFSNNASVTVVLDNCIVEISSGAGTSSRGLWIESGTWILRNGSKVVVTSGTSKYAIYNDVAAATITIGAGCELNGATADIYSDQSASVITLNNAILTNGLISWAGVLNWETENKISKNLLYSSMTHNLWQEGLTLNDLADDTYGPDTVWNVINKDNAPDISGQAGGSTDPFTISFRCTFDSNTAQAGIVQFLEAEDTYPLRGQVVSLSADLWGTNITTLRMAVIIWTSTADAVTSDVVGTWAAGNPTLAANWAYIGTPAAITITGTRARYTQNNLLVPTNANNLGVFIWTDAAESSGDLWNIARVQLERGPIATEFVARSLADELARVQWFFLKTFNLLVAPGVSTVNQYAEITTRNLAASTAGTVLITTGAFPARMRTTPTVVLYSPATGTANAVRNASAGADRTGCSVVSLGDSRFSQIDADNTSATVISSGQGIQFHFTANARL